MCVPLLVVENRWVNISRKEGAAKVLVFVLVTSRLLQLPVVSIEDDNMITLGNY